MNSESVGGLLFSFSQSLKFIINIYADIFNCFGGIYGLEVEDGS